MQGGQPYLRYITHIEYNIYYIYYSHHDIHVRVGQPYSHYNLPGIQSSPCTTTCLQFHYTLLTNTCHRAPQSPFATATCCADNSRAGTDLATLSSITTCCSAPQSPFTTATCCAGTILVQAHILLPYSASQPAAVHERLDAQRPLAAQAQ